MNIHTASMKNVGAWIRSGIHDFFEKMLSWYIACGILFLMMFALVWVLMIGLLLFMGSAEGLEQLNILIMIIWQGCYYFLLYFCTYGIFIFALQFQRFSKQKVAYNYLFILVQNFQRFLLIGVIFCIISLIQAVLWKFSQPSSFLVLLATFFVHTTLSFVLVNYICIATLLTLEQPKISAADALTLSYQALSKNFAIVLFLSFIMAAIFFLFACIVTVLMLNMYPEIINEQGVLHPSTLEHLSTETNILPIFIILACILVPIAIGIIVNMAIQAYLTIFKQSEST